MGDDGLVVLSEDGRSLGRAPTGAGEADAPPSRRTHALIPTRGRSSPSLRLELPELCPQARGKAPGRHEQPPNPAPTPPSLQRRYLKQTIAMITTTMTKSSPAVAEPTIRGSSWKALPVEPGGGGGRNQSQAVKGACRRAVGWRQPSPGTHHPPQLSETPWGGCSGRIQPPCVPGPAPSTEHWPSARPAAPSSSGW